MLPIPDATLERLADVVHRRLGLHFPPERWRDLARGVEAACRDLGEPGVEACTHTLLSTSLDRRQLEILGRHLTVGETYFFREPQAFRHLASEILPELTARRRGTGKVLRLWSAACATGEEPYSMAILLRERLPDIEEWNVTLLATDINPEFLRRADRGTYREWSFRGERGDVREAWFDRTAEGRYRIRPEVRKMVSFAYHNLADDPYPSLANGTNAMDVIFCRNVLMYFSEENRREVLNRLQQCLVEGGVLFVGAAESALPPSPGLEPLCFPDLVAYRKRAFSGGAPPSSAPPLPRSAARREAPAAAGKKKEEEPVSLLREPFLRGDYALVCRRAAALSPHQPACREAALMAARACANSGSLEHALSWVDAAVSHARTDPETHYLRAMILDELGRTGDSLDALRTTLYLDPDFIPAWMALGNIHRREGDRRQAERSYRNALVLLDGFGEDDPVPHADGMRGGRLREAVAAALGEAK